MRGDIERTRTCGADKTAGGEEVFIPLTQKNLTTGAGVKELGKPG